MRITLINLINDVNSLSHYLAALSQKYSIIVLYTKICITHIVESN